MGALSFCVRRWRVGLWQKGAFSVMPAPEDPSQAMNRHLARNG